MRLPATLDDERLDAVLVEVVHEQRQRTVVGEHKAFGVWSHPVADGELRTLADVGSMAYEDGILLGTQPMGEQLCLGIRYLYRLEVLVNETVSRPCPLQDDVRAVLTVEREEASVEPLALLFQDAYRDLDACIAQLTDATALHLAERVDTPHDTAPDTLTDNQVGTGRRLAVMGAGLQRDVDGCLLQQRLILRSDRGKGIHLGVALAIALVVTLADNPVTGHDDRTHHGVRPCILQAVGCQLQAAAHEFLVYLLLIHGGKGTKKVKK